MVQGLGEKSPVIPRNCNKARGCTGYMPPDVEGLRHGNQSVPDGAATGNGLGRKTWAVSFLRFACGERWGGSCASLPRPLLAATKAMRA